MILGSVVVLVGFAVSTDRPGMTVGGSIAVVGILVKFAWPPYYPVWGLLRIAASVFVIRAVTVDGRDITD